MVTIIGAGPAGSYTAYLLSKNKEVNVYEDHNQIGQPIQCAGITTNILKNIIKLNNDVILNEVNKARIFAPNKKFIEVNLRENNLVIDRSKFDNQIAEMAKQRGAKFFLNHKFIENNKDVAIIKDKKSGQMKKVRFDYLIGADGPLSQVAKSNNMFEKKEFWQGIQTRTKLKNDNVIEFYPYFGTYSWIIPENKDIVRIGLASKKYAKTLFKNFVFKFKRIKEKNLIDYQAGIIPQYDPRKISQKENIFLVGDAACHVKATTGGGIIQSLIASKALSHSILENKNYEKEWRRLLGKELYFHLKARNIMDKFKEKDWNKLINIISSDQTKQILEMNDRENISKIIFKLIVKKPSLLYFIKYLI